MFVGVCMYVYTVGEKLSDKQNIYLMYFMFRCNRRLSVLYFAVHLRRKHFRTKKKKKKKTFKQKTIFIFHQLNY